MTLGEAQAIAENVVGAVRWRGAEGECRCPGIEKHTGRNAATDCKAVCEPIALPGGTLAPGVYCFHGSCAAEVEVASRELRSALGRRSAARPGRSARSARERTVFHTVPPPRAPRVFDPAALERVAQRLPGVNAEWLAARSRSGVYRRRPASILHELYETGERVVIFDVFGSQGQAVWTREEPPYDVGTLDSFACGRKQGVWFLANPVTGEYAPNDQGHRSRRSWQNVTSWRYLVIESDEANPAHWLSALAQMPLRISAIYTSGGKSIHALVRLDAVSKEDWDARAAHLKPGLITLGADPKAISAVRLTRLPSCERREKWGLQTLLYLNGAPDGTPICEQPPQT